MLVGARLLQFAGALVVLGTSLFCIYGSQTDPGTSPALQSRRWLKQVLILSAATAAIGTVLWIMAETVLFSGDPTDGTRPAAVWVVFAETRFGRVCLLRLGLLGVSLTLSLLARRGRVFWFAQSLLASVVVATFAWTGHGTMDSGWPGLLHSGGDVLHLWFAGVWFGALVPLLVLIFLAIQSRQPADAQAAHYGLERFSAIGVTVVVALTITGLINSGFLIGIAHWRAMTTTSYGNVLLVKLGLFAMMLVLAAVNRFWWSRRLHSALGASDEELWLSSLRSLRRSVLTESGMAVLLVLAVAMLGTLAPPSSAD